VIHPREVLLGAQVAAPLPVCDHYCGVQSRMEKSLALQRAMTQELGACVFDVTLDCEDGAPVGGENDHAFMVAALANQAVAATKDISPDKRPRVAVRVHAVDHPAFAQDVQIVLGQAAPALCHIMLPKVQSLAQVEQALALIDPAAQASGRASPMPVHVLIESPAAVLQVASMVAHPRVASASFGLMDFVSAHGGAIPASAMASRGGSPDAPDQFNHPLVLRAKLEIAAACHAHGKVPAHCVVTEFKDAARVAAAARLASRHLGYTRMWSIHPDQIQPILEAFAPSVSEVDTAAEVLLAAQAARWAPTALHGHLHDRASYRYHWQVLERAHRTGHLPAGHPAAAFFNEISL
jgi:citrate lyase subunit beta/citryl-CoA lyase